MFAKIAYQGIKWLGITIAVVLVSLVLMLEIGSRMSLDQDYTHRRETKSLPVLGIDSGSGLVQISANGHQFRARVAGFEQPDKPAVILLHGFPVTSAMWIELIDPLVAAGFRVLAFDQRGYSPGARPEQVGEYTVPKLTSDVIAVADAAGLERFHLVGHDWGSVVGWSTVLQHPGRVLSWTGLSIAHPTAFTDALENDPDQGSRSAYFLLFQTPWLPEALFSVNDFWALRGGYSNMSSLQQSEYISVFSEPGALTGSLNWYRAITMSIQNRDQLSPEIRTPTLFIWGNNDQAVGRWAVEAQAQYMKGPYHVIELDAGHWLLEDNPDRVINAVVEHVTNNNL